MNKKLLAIAIGAATALPVVAEAAGPTVYGKINLSLESVVDAVDTRRDGDLDNLPGAVIIPAGTEASDEGWVLRSNDSRIGIKGEAETGITGVTGIYQAEFSLTADGEGGPFGNRDIFAGVKGPFGQVRLGNMDTPFKKAQGKVDQFNDTAADIRSHISGEVRYANSIYYTSPKIMEALSIHLAVAPGEGVDDPESAVAADVLDGPADFMSAAVVWEGENLYLAAAMDQGTKQSSSFLGAEIGASNFVDATRLVAGYKLDAIQLGFLYQVAEEVGTSTTPDEDTSMVASLGWTIGEWLLKAQFATTEGDDGTAGNADNEITQMAVGADYKLGKSTTLFAFYSTLEDDEGGTVAGDDDNYDVMSIGIDQKF